MKERPRVEDLYPLSPLQQGLLFHALLAPGSDVYVFQVSVALRGALDDAAFERAWAAVIARHPALRSAFVRLETEAPLQAVREQVTLPLERHDWRALPAEERTRRLRALEEQARRAPFALNQAPLMRLALARLEDDLHAVVWSYHQLLLDGWSMALVFKEALGLYRRLRRGEAVEPGRGRPYRAYLEWLQRQELGAAEAFWRRELEGFTAPTRLGIERNVAQADLPASAVVERRLPEAKAAALQALARANGLTLSTVVQGAWALVLGRFSGQREVLFGATLAGRPPTLAGSEEIVGPFINTVPVRCALSPEEPVLGLLARLQRRQVERGPHELAPLGRIQGWSEVPRGTSLFDSLVVFQNYPQDWTVEGTGLEVSSVRFSESTHYPLVLTAERGQGLALVLTYQPARFDAAGPERLLAHLELILDAIAADPHAWVGRLPALPIDEAEALLTRRNATRAPYPDEVRLDALFEAQAARTPDAPAVRAGDQVVTYAELSARARRLAHHLQSLGVGPETPVGLCVERSVDLVVGLLGILQAGGGYLPLDPAYPRERLALMLEDSGAKVVVTQHSLAALAGSAPHVVCLDAPLPAPPSAAAPTCAATAESLAYLIYTSGSTGRPKGVMVTHRNAVSFLAAMDARVGDSAAGTWAAVTSVSFDISVLELFWTLARGFQVVLQRPQGAAARRTARRPLDFSLFYFAADEGEPVPGRYRLLLDGARFADAHGFRAVWVPERHFHAFGGLYPNPSVVAAAVAAVTERVRIRAGSVVLPLNHPVRVAEDWAVVDNLSGGRVGLSVASGWNASDFVLAPERYARRREEMLEGLEKVRRLWRGEALTMPDGQGQPQAVAIRPRPLQPELPVWLTAAGNPETFRAAGRLGVNLLTHLLGQSVEQLAEKLALYRQAWRDAGHPGEGKVTLMLHTFLGTDAAAVKEKVRAPFSRYLRTSAELAEGFARQRADVGAVGEEDVEALVAAAFERYFGTSGLFGTPDGCRPLVERLRAVGVDELACLIDFGVEPNEVLAALPQLDALRAACQQPEAEEPSLAEALRAHQVTHLQCTPSLALALVEEPEGLAALGALRRLMVGGEALPPGLADRLAEAVPGGVLNMYGPTETTVWSLTHRIASGERPVRIGTPIPNTTVYLLDAALRPVPEGVPGELCIGGAGVARGYWNQPALTADRFVPGPWGDAGGRLYRTGDLARWLPDGTLEFLGRGDAQVKLRGHRIELGEVEATLCRQPGVREAVAVVREDAPGDRRLVAYWVTTGAVDAAPPDAELRRGLQRALPDAMVPSTFVRLEALPRTPNGKVDRKALPVPGAGVTGVRAARVPPRSPLERTLAEIWCRVLRVEQVGVHDNFFELGGDSILTLQVVAQARKAGVALTPRRVFDAPTLAALAEWAEGEARPTPSVSVVAAAELPYWRELLATGGEPLPAVAASVAQPPPVLRSLDPDETRALLRDVLDGLHATAEEALLGPLARAVRRWTGRDALLVELTPGADRPAYPVRLEGDASAEHPGEALKAVKAQVRRTPRGGEGYHAVRDQLRELPRPQVALTWHGETSLSARALGEAAIRVDAALVDGRLTLSVAGTPRNSDAQRLQQLTDDLLASLRALLHHAGHADAAGVVTSDFPDANLAQSDLEAFLGRLTGGR